MQWNILREIQFISKLFYHINGSKQSVRKTKCTIKMSYKCYGNIVLGHKVMQGCMWGILDKILSMKLMLFRTWKKKKIIINTNELKRKFDPARTRTWNTLIRSQMPHPLGHRAMFIRRESRTFTPSNSCCYFQECYLTFFRPSNLNI